MFNRWHLERLATMVDRDPVKAALVLLAAAAVIFAILIPLLVFAASNFFPIVLTHGDPP